MANNPEKHFKTLDEQSFYLVSTKNVVDDPVIKEILSERSYVSIINPYKKLFSKGVGSQGHTYYENIDFKQYMEMAALDDFCSSILYQWIGMFERKLKLAIAYEISLELNNHDDQEGTSYVSILEEYFLTGNERRFSELGFLEINQRYNFDGGIEISDKFIEVRVRLLTEKILNIGNRTTLSQNTIVEYYQMNHHKVPFWLLVHELSLGDMEVIVGMLKPDMRRRIYSYFFDDQSSPKKINRFANYIGTIRSIRNITNHYEPFFSILFKRTNHEQLLATVKFLKLNYCRSIIQQVKLPIEIQYQTNDYNRNHLEVIKQLYSEMKLK